MSAAKGHGDHSGGHDKHEEHAPAADHAGGGGGGGGFSFLGNAWVMGILIFLGWDIGMFFLPHPKEYSVTDRASQRGEWIEIFSDAWSEKQQVETRFLDVDVRISVRSQGDEAPVRVAMEDGSECTDSSLPEKFPDPSRDGVIDLRFRNGGSGRQWVKIDLLPGGTLTTERAVQAAQATLAPSAIPLICPIGATAEEDSKLFVQWLEAEVARRKAIREQEVRMK